MQRSCFSRHFGYDVPQEVLGQASAEQMQEHAAARARELLPYGPSGWAGALHQIESIPYRGSNNPLYLEEARIRFLNGGGAEILRLVDEGLQHALAAQDGPRTLDLICLKAWMLEDARQYDQLAACLPYLVRTAERLGRPLPRIQELAQRYRLAALRQQDSQARQPLEALAPRLINLTVADLMELAPTLRDVIAPAASVQPQAAVNVVSLLATLRRSMRSSVFSKLDALLTSRGLAHIIDSKELARALSADAYSEYVPELAQVADEILRNWPSRLPYVPILPVSA